MLHHQDYTSWLISFNIDLVHIKGAIRIDNGP